MAEGDEFFEGGGVFGEGDREVGLGGELCVLEEFAVRLLDLCKEVGGVCVLGVLGWVRVGEGCIFGVGVDDVLS